MEVRPGYKKTTEGIIPSDWTSDTLGALGAFKNGINKAAEDFGHGSPLVNLMDVFGVQKITASTADLGLIKSTAVEQQTYDLKKGDVLFVRSSVKPDGVGLTTLIAEDLPATVFSGFLIRFREATTLTTEFKEYCFHEQDFRKRLIASSTVSANTNINQDALRGLRIGFPTRHSEQRAIASALSNVDALMSGLDRLIAKKRDLKQAAMQQLLTGQTRLPGFEGEWEVKRLGDLLTICHGKSQHEVEVDDGAYPILATGGQIGTSKRPLYDKPSVLIGRKGTINQPQYMDTPFWTVDTLFYSAIKDDNSAKFIYYRFCLIDWMQYNEASGVPSLNARTIENVEVDCPKPVEQEEIAKLLSDMDAELAALEARREKTRLLKQGMMQELLTGKTRLIIPERDDA